MLATIRLDADTERALNRVVRASGRTRSEVIREAIQQLVQRTPIPSNDGTPYTSVVDLIGIARGGAADLSVRTGDKLRALLAVRPRGRRT